jgi:hypothetical protein
MEPQSLLDAWMLAYGDLDAGQRATFLSHPAVAELVVLPDPAVIHALGRARHLTVILDIALKEGWWFAGEACEGDNLSFCSRCKPHGFPSTVYMTCGWSSAFHKSPSCAALRGGQRAVADRDGTPAEVEPVQIQVALASGRHPCQVCLGGRSPS